MNLSSFLSHLNFSKAKQDAPEKFEKIKKEIKKNVFIHD